ncbi:pyruvate dehydrogenase complex dihydrolipoamide acetyltransferase [Nitrospirillum sp. BR 11163]|uniref:pyruvate dehydrogenase complex dihydrolipoamide acetyltransferase n=1 Tax=Nitrospirillum sp. BR 11163 TaxID=3104323 RepID=UPI002AFFAB0B|nr:pyruvate dehydrogenase complex dihydrolipoamide acetyltransferase [Nitrospirillum sp. BR 11163]MEA1676467.1 pyruvate dehydrogenase complex dihydrolipoamide acetyltransferase [Nitrospirillum sp. BR 11163]
MPIDILMPALSPTMTEGKLAKWVKKEGDTIKAGDVIAEIETDKATMEVEAVDEGTLGKILVPEGTEGVAVNAKIAVLLEEGESADALNAAPKAAATPAPAPTAAKTEAAAPAPAKSEAAPSAAAPAPAAAPAHDGKRVFASPLARRMAAQSGLDLAKVSGTGPSGRIVKADVEAALKGGAAKAAPVAAAAPTAPAAAAPAPAAAPKGIDAKALADKLGMKYKVLPNSGMRKTIAKRLTEAWQTIPHFGLQVDCEIDALLALRAQLNEKSGEKVSVNDFVVKAVAVALRKVPEANVSWHEDGILQYEGVDVSVAVATDGGLITPIVKNADQKGLATISAEVKSLAAKAKEGKLKPEEFQGGTFSVSNLGMFGIKSFTSIINPPQSCILSVGAGEKRPVVKGDALAVATVMSLTLTVDHRSVDGAVGAKYLQVLKKLIEDPITLML